jgi:hypothetical protein
MTTINPSKEETYNSEDRKLLISLLNEYAEKLSILCVRIDIHNDNSRILLLAQIWLMFPIFIALFVVTIHGIFGLRGYISDEAANSILTSSVVVLITLFLINEVFYNKKKLRLLERDGNTIAIKLEKVIRLASQIQEHALNNVVSRIELDLRLADAESALEHYYEAKQGKK